MENFENKPNQAPTSGPTNKKPCCELSEQILTIIKGWFALILGVIFILFASKIIIRILALLCGLILIYYGLVILKVEKITQYISEKVRNLKKLFE